MAQIDGMPTAADINLYTVALSPLLKYLHATLGLNVPGEASTAAVYADTAIAKLLGDGTTSNPGLTSPTWKADIKTALQSLPYSYRWDNVTSSKMAGFMRELDSLVRSNLPSGWGFFSAGGLGHHFDAHLTRINACNPNVPTTATATPTLTAGNFSTGAMPTVAAGSATRFVYTLKGALDCYETLPSPEATQVALTGAQNGYTVATGLSGTVPVGITKIGLYRGLLGGGSGGPYYWIKDIPVSAGVTWASYTVQLLEPDQELKLDVQPPSWLSALVSPEMACMFALAYPSAQFQSPGSVPTAINLDSTAMLSPWNVMMNPASGFQGLGNPSSAAEFGRSTITAANTQSYVAGTVQQANNAALNVQGFLGGKGIQARILTTVNGTATLTLSYTYYQKSTGYGSLQTQTGVTLVVSSGTVGQVFTVAGIPSDRIIRSVTVTAVAGTATAGVAVLEATQGATY